MTFADYTAEWFARKRLTLRGNTVRTYDHIVRLQLLPLLGHVPLAELRRPMIRRALMEVRATGRAVGSCRNDLRVLSSILNEAVDLELIPHNPASGAARGLFPPARKFRRPPLEPFQLRALMKAAEGEFRDFWMLMMFLTLTGVRIGEALGIGWGDYDPRVHRLMVARQWQRGRIEDTKTGEVQAIDTPKLLAGLMDAHRDLRPGTAFVFENQKRGLPYSYTYVNVAFRAAREAAKLDARWSIHSVRHLYGTQLMAFAPTEYVQRQMRHLTIATTEQYAGFRTHRHLDGLNAMARHTVQGVRGVRTRTLPLWIAT